VCVVSDHGFAAVEHDVNLYTAFRQAVCSTADDANKILTWKAMPWAGGRPAAILLQPDDDAVRAEVAALLDRLAQDPGNGNRSDPGPR